MANNIFLPTILILALTSCSDNRTQEKPKQETPKALQDNSSSYEIISKRSSDDLVESLYNELMTKNIDLKTLEDKIDELNTSKSDTIELFDKFDKKNQSYFNSADNHISDIKDSFLRDNMKLLIANDLKKYDASVARHNELLKIIEAKGLTLSDLHNILKIVKTLPLIEKYQRDNLPNTKSFEGYIKRQDESIKLADTLAKK
ncbi:MAG: hypothetical protein JWQ27_61 [Ferruginibacter sp.]|nr:hypothetical protein [Ferruginibacter sp.]